MNNFLDSIKITTFELIAYLLPGYIVIMFFGYLTGFDLIHEKNILVPILISSFVLGHVIHNLSTFVTLDLRTIGWKIYQLTKEADAQGKGVKDPKSFWGKFAKNLRYKFLERRKKYYASLTNLANDKVKEKHAIKVDLNGLDMFFIKEVIFAKEDKVANYFLFVHYYSVLSRSLALVAFLLFGAYSFLIWFQADYSINSIGAFITSALLYKVFLNRHLFYKNYRSKLVDANAILSSKIN